MFASDSNIFARIIFAVPFYGMLFAGVFRLDVILGTPKKTSGLNTRAGRFDTEGDPIFLEPDGTRLLPVQKKQKRE